MKKLGRPKTVGRDKAINTRLSEDEIKRLDAGAKKAGLSRADYIVKLMKLEEEKEAGE